MADAGGGASAVGLGPIVEDTCGGDLRAVMTVGVGAEAIVDVGAVTGSDSEAGWADPLHPDSPRRIRVPSNNDPTRTEVLSTPVDFSPFI